MATKTADWWVSLRPRAGMNGAIAAYSYATCPHGVEQACPLLGIDVAYPAGRRQKFVYQDTWQCADLFKKVAWTIWIDFTKVPADAYERHEWLLAKVCKMLNVGTDIYLLSKANRVTDVLEKRILVCLAKLEVRRGEV